MTTMLKFIDGEMVEVNIDDAKGKPKKDKKVKYIDGTFHEYEIYKLVDFHNPILRKPTEWVDPSNVTTQLAHEALSLMETLNELEGLGLSANQVGLSHRMFALNVGEQIVCLLNPTLVFSSKNKSSYAEGCLSYPGLYLKVGRPESIIVEFNLIGKEDRIQQQFDGLTATCVLHEMDHLDGIMYTDKVPKITLMKAKEKIKTNLKRMKRLQKEQAA